jgi:hypothetical protein
LACLYCYFKNNSAFQTQQTLKDYTYVRFLSGAQQGSLLSLISIEAAALSQSILSVFYSLIITHGIFVPADIDHAISVLLVAGN